MFDIDVQEWNNWKNWQITFQIQHVIDIYWGDYSFKLQI